MFLGRAKTPDIAPGVPGPDRLFLEDDAERVAASLASGGRTEYFFIPLDGAVTTLHPVTLKAGARAAGPDTEFVEIVARGNVVGTTRVDK